MNTNAFPSLLRALLATTALTILIAAPAFSRTALNCMQPIHKVAGGMQTRTCNSKDVTPTPRMGSSQEMRWDAQNQGWRLRPEPWYL